MDRPRYAPLSEYGIVGNLETACLVSRYGSIDWCPLPDVESSSIFAALLDHDRGGHFQVSPSVPFQSAQRYVGQTNVLATDFYMPAGRATLTDWMLFPDTDRTDPTAPIVYRKIECTEGTVEFDVDCRPRPDYARRMPEVVATGEGVVARDDTAEIHLTGSPAFAIDDHDISASMSLSEGEEAWLALSYGEPGPVDLHAVQASLDQTVDAWRQWVNHRGHPSRRAYDGRWQHLVVRSGLVLKLLTHFETNAIAAAPTTSLPEEIGGTRNWDYRFNWIRDAAMTVQALYKLDHVDEAKGYFTWLLSHVYEGPERIQPLYDLHGGGDIDEQTLDHLEGYRNSAPVRIGNAAHSQRQLDIYGEMLLALFETSRYGEAITQTEWRAMREIVNFIEDVWDEPDLGIWEVRTEPRHFVHSKVMSWTALDRAITVVEATDFDGPVDRWRSSADAIREAILKRGFNRELGSFVQTFETDTALDATALLIPIVGFLPIDDPRVQRTIDTIKRRLTTEEGLVYRYDGEDGLPGNEGTFVLCSFWLVNALALSGRIGEAERLFDTIIGYTTPLGLLAEQIDPDTGELLGNFPQAFSHIGLINSALYIDQVKRRPQPGPDPLGAETDPGEDVEAEVD